MLSIQANIIQTQEGFDFIFPQQESVNVIGGILFLRTAAPKSEFIWRQWKCRRGCAIGGDLEVTLPFLNDWGGKHVWPFISQSFVSVPPVRPYFSSSFSSLRVLVRWGCRFDLQSLHCEELRVTEWGRIFLPSRRYEIRNYWSWQLSRSRN